MIHTYNVNTFQIAPKCVISEHPMLLLEMVVLSETLQSNGFQTFWFNLWDSITWIYSGYGIYVYKTDIFKFGISWPILKNLFYCWYLATCNTTDTIFISHHLTKKWDYSCKYWDIQAQKRSILMTSTPRNRPWITPNNTKIKLILKVKG